MKNIHLIPTDRPSRLIHNDSNQLCYQSNKSFKNDRKWMYRKKFNIYITSDEEIKEGDYCISHLNIIDEGKIHNSQTIFNPKTKEHLILLQSCKKIILTTDTQLIQDGVQPIDYEFLEWFIKNPSCEKVEVEQILDACDTTTESWTKYKIIIPSSEIWKDIPEFEGYYQISNLGNVKSLSRTILGRGKHDTLLKERLLKFSTSTNGYYQVILQKEGFKKIYKVHSLVAICFLNHTPDGTHNVVIDHINEIKTDNKLENLRLIGHRENVSRSMKNNTSTYVGVSWSKNAKKWISQITIEGKTKYLGLFDNEEDANKKYLETLKDL